MIVYVLDKNFQKKVLIEDYISLIWTERFCKAGDFEFVVLVNEENYQYLTRGNYLIMEDSDRIMVIETRELENDPINGDRLRVSGNSFEYTLNRHICTIGLYTGPVTDTASSILKFSGNASSIYSSIITKDFINGSNRGVGDLIGIDNENFSKSISYFSDEIPTIYEVFSTIGEKYNIGYKITYKELDSLDDMQKLIFTSYMATDKTVDQTVRSPIVFSSNYDNLTYAKYLESSEDCRNTAFIIGHSVEYETVFPGKADPENPKIPNENYRKISGVSYRQGYVTEILRDIWTYKNNNCFWYPNDQNNPNKGLNRRELALDTRNDIKPEDYGLDDPENYEVQMNWEQSFYNFVNLADEYATDLKSYVQEELDSKEYNEVTFEASGSIDNLTQWVYGRDYFLGDIVNLLDDYGLAMTVLIDEVIMSYDESGIEITPNFTTLGYK